MFPRNKVAKEMKNRIIWVCVRGRNKEGIKDVFFVFVFFWPQTTGRIVVIFAEMRNSGEDWVRWKKMS